MKRLSKPTTHNEQGIVSLIVTIILMLVISLIVISFARTSRREQSDALDRQLSTNAFYAAESGINDAKKAIAADPANLTSQAYTTNCSGFAGAAHLTIPSDPIGSTNSNASYTCLFMDPSVPTIEHIYTTDPYSFPLAKDGNGNLGVLEFYWDGLSSGGTVPDFTGCPNPPGTNPAAPTSWPTSHCSAGPLRLELTDSSDLTKNYVYFIYPSNHADNINYKNNADPNGSIRRADCYAGQKPHMCMFRVNLGLNNQTAYARVSSLYMGYELTVKAPGGQEFAGAQVMIDSTGKAADVQRRIQVRYNLNDFYGPQYALQSGTATCKRYIVNGTEATDKSLPQCWPAPTYSNGTQLP